MNRIRVLGSSGSGKTTTATAIAERLGLPRLELDRVHWLPEWKERSVEEFRRIVTEFVETHDRWVIDGNYTSRSAGLIDDRVDAFVWLDLPRWRVMAALLARTIRRSFTREELWDTGNTEKITNLFSLDPNENIAMWSWTNHHKNRQRYGARAAADPDRWVRLRSRRAVKRFLESLGPH